MLKVAQIIDTLGVGGAEALQVTLAKELKSKNIDLTILCLTEWMDLREEIEKLGVNVICVTGSTLFAPRRIIRLVQIIRREKIDVIHTHLNTANILGVIAGKICGIPVVSTLHNVQLGKKKARLIRHPIETQTLRLSKVIIGVGQEVANAHQKRWPDKEIVVIRNAVSEIGELPEEKRKEIRKELLGLDIERPLLLTVGRIHPQKGHVDLFEAMTDVVKLFPGALLAIAGRGPSERVEKLQKRVDELGLNEHIKMLGVRRDIPQLLKSCDIFVVSSHWEGLPVAMLEAMSAGLPIVSTSVGEIPQVLADERGLLVPPKEPGKLAQGIIMLLSKPDYARQLGINAAEHVQAEFTASAWADKLVKIYQEVVLKGALNR